MPSKGTTGYVTRGKDMMMARCTFRAGSVFATNRLQLQGEAWMQWGLIGT